MLWSPICGAQNTWSSARHWKDISLHSVSTLCIQPLCDESNDALHNSILVSLFISYVVLKMTFHRCSFICLSGSSC